MGIIESMLTDCLQIDRATCNLHNEAILETTDIVHDGCLKVRVVCELCQSTVVSIDYTSKVRFLDRVFVVCTSHSL